MRHIQSRLKKLLDSLAPHYGAALLGLFLAGLPLTGWAQTFNPNTNWVFGQPNSLGIGVRAMGMGGAFTAISDDDSAAYWNPAGLAQLTSYEITASSAPVYFDNGLVPATNGQNPSWQGFDFPWYESLQFMFPITKDNTLGISFWRPYHPQSDFLSGSNFSQAEQEQASYILNPTLQESVIALSYAARISAVRDLSIGINVKRVTNDPYYLLPINTDLASQLSNVPRLIGYGVDLGLLYRIPVTKYTEEVRFGIDVRDLVTRVTIPDTVMINDPTFSTPLDLAAGSDVPVPPQITLGIAYKNNYLFNVRNITAFDFDQISDTRFTGGNNGGQNAVLRFGTEFWFFRDVLGIRGGYWSQLDEPGYFSLGGSIRALGGDFQLDGVYLMPIQQVATLQNGSSIASTNTSDWYFEPFHLELTYRFGGGEEIPPPKVDAFVRPPSFTPSQGEKATFYLDTTEDIPIKRWSVLIYDSFNHLVRGLRGSGSPPTKLVWGGEDDQYEPLPPAVYTWSLQVQDTLDHIGSTPVQTVEILGPPEPPAARDPAQLLALRQQQAALLSQERQQLTALAQQNLQNLLGTEAPTPTTGATPPLEAIGNTLVPEAGGAPAIGFTNLTPDQVLAAHFDKNAQGEPIVAVSYRSQLTYGPYLYQEAADVIKASVKTVGTGLKAITTRVYYGKNELTVETPTEVAANYAIGRISEPQLLQLSDIHINGVKVGPNVQ